MIQLKGYQRSYLTREAHELKPVVMIGAKGLTDEVAGAAKETLAAHELIKVRFVDYKEDRKVLARELASKVDAVVVQVIGHVAIIYKPKEDPEERIYKLPQR